MFKESLTVIRPSFAVEMLVAFLFWPSARLFRRATFVGAFAISIFMAVDAIALVAVPGGCGTTCMAERRAYQQRYGWNLNWPGFTMNPGWYSPWFTQSVQRPVHSGMLPHYSLYGQCLNCNYARFPVYYPGLVLPGTITY